MVFQVLVRRSECDVKLDSCLRWKEYKEIFESLRGYCHQNLKSIPLMFVLGFYVSIVVTRYRNSPRKYCTHKVV